MAVVLIIPILSHFGRDAVYHKQTTMFSVPCDFRCTAMVEAVATLVPEWILKSKLNNFWYPVRYSLTLREILLVSPSCFFCWCFSFFHGLHHDFTRCLSFSSLQRCENVTEAGPMMIINATRILGYTAMAFAAAALGTQQLAAYQARFAMICVARMVGFCEMMAEHTVDGKKSCTRLYSWYWEFPMFFHRVS